MIINQRKMKFFAKKSKASLPHLFLSSLSSPFSFSHTLRVWYSLNPSPHLFKVTSSLSLTTIFIGCWLNKVLIGEFIQPDFFLVWNWSRVTRCHDSFTFISLSDLLGSDSGYQNSTRMARSLSGEMIKWLKSIATQQYHQQKAQTWF